MIELLTLQDTGRQAELLNQMFGLRHRIFKEKLGWTAGSDNGREVDEFDTDSAYYLAALSQQRDAVVGAWRLIPTTRKTMVGSVFLTLMEGAQPPCDNHVWEVSRFVVDPLYREGRVDSVKHTTAELICGLLEFALAYDIRHIITVQDLVVSRLVNRVMNLQPSWKSTPQRLGERPATASTYEIRSDTLLHLRKRYRVDAPILHQFRIQDTALVA